MQTALQKNFWVVTAAFVVGASFLTARIAAVGLSGYLWAPHELQAPEDGKKSQAAPAARMSDYRVIEERNLFNANPAPFTPEAPGAGEPAAPVAPERPEKIPLRLVATAVMSGQTSFAVIEMNGESRIYKEGSSIPPDGNLVQVKKDRILVKRGKFEDEYLLFTERPAEAGAPAARRGPSPTVPGIATQETPPPTGDTIRQVNENSWLVDRREVDMAVQNLSQLITQIRIVPNNLPDGRTDGFRIFSIRPASLFSRIGLKNGDVIKQVNGTALTGIDQAYQVFSKIQGESSIQLNLLRRDQPLTLSYDIR